MKNIVLIGMPASGKSHVGMLLAKKLGRNFFDTDKEIERRYKKPVQKIITEDGWKAFRDRESRVCSIAGKKKNMIICTGAGAILRKQNQRALKENSTIVFLDVPLEDLAHRLANSKSTHRPHINPEAAMQQVQELWAVRGPIYQKVADCTFDARNLGGDKKGDVQEHADELYRQLRNQQLI